MRMGTLPSARSCGAFTLIELLIVVAIIAILAAIAVPNFLEAQTRSKVARVYSDFRTMKTAMEAYRVDNNDYILDSGGPDAEDRAYKMLTTPIAYTPRFPAARSATSPRSTGTSGTTNTGAAGPRLTTLGQWSTTSSTGSLPWDRTIFATLGVSLAYPTGLSLSRRCGRNSSTGFMMQPTGRSPRAI